MSVVIGAASRSCSHRHSRPAHLGRPKRDGRPHVVARLPPCAGACLPTCPMLPVLSWHGEERRTRSLAADATRIHSVEMAWVHRWSRNMHRSRGAGKSCGRCSHSHSRPAHLGGPKRDGRPHVVARLPPCAGACLPTGPMLPVLSWHGEERRAGSLATNAVCICWPSARLPSALLRSLSPCSGDLHG